MMQHNLFSKLEGDTNTFQPGDRSLFRWYLICLVKLRRAYEKSLEWFDSGLSPT